MKTHLLKLDISNVTSFVYLDTDLFFGSFLLFMFRVCHAFLSVHCSLVVTCSERADLLALLYVIFVCVLVTLPWVRCSA